MLNLVMYQGPQYLYTDNVTISSSLLVSLTCKHLTSSTFCLTCSASPNCSVLLFDILIHNKHKLLILYYSILTPVDGEVFLNVAQLYLLGHLVGFIKNKKVNSVLKFYLYT